MEHEIHQMAWLRRFVMPMLKAISMDINIRHHWVPAARISLNSYRHKGYWYHGKARERATLRMMEKILRPDDTVLEVGGHIGYFSVFFSHLVGPKGKVIVFEPGMNNLPYIQRNIGRLDQELFAPIELIRAAAGAADGEAVLYEENLTGQNNSLVSEFAGLRTNMGAAHVATEIEARKVAVRAIDSLALTAPIRLMKIDVEGFEWNVLQGGEATISAVLPVIMVEVQADRDSIFEFLRVRDYVLFNDQMEPLTKPEQLQGNVFCFNAKTHSDLVKRFSGKDWSASLSG